MSLGFLRQQSGTAPQGPVDLPLLMGGSWHFFVNPDLGAPTVDNTPGAESFSLPEMSGSGVTFTQTLGACPIYSATDATLFSRPTFAGNGSSKSVVSNWNPPQPSTTNMWFYAVVKQNTWGSGKTLWGSNSTTHIRTSGITSTPSVRITNGGTAHDTNQLTIGSWKRIIILYTGVSGNDKVKIGGNAEVTGLNLGNGNPTQFHFFVDGGFLDYGDYTIALCGCRTTEPSAGAITAADTAVTLRYGSIVGV